MKVSIKTSSNSWSSKLQCRKLRGSQQTRRRTPSRIGSSRNTDSSRVSKARVRSRRSLTMKAKSTSFKMNTCLTTISNLKAKLCSSVASSGVIASSDTLLVSHRFSLTARRLAGTRLCSVATQEATSLMGASSR